MIITNSIYFSRFLVVSMAISFLIATSCDQKSTKEKLPEEFSFKFPENYFEDSTLFEPLSKIYKNEKKAEIEKFFHQNLDSLGFSGGFLVAKNGRIIFEKYAGFSSFKNQRKVNQKTAVHLASVGKVLTATAIFRLIEQGDISLDQKVYTILPKFPYKEITVRMLLNHRSGVPKYAYFASDTLHWDVTKVLRNQDVLNILAKKKLELDFPPNTKFTYCNTNYVLLALIVEEKTGKSFKEAMKFLVFDPIGMKNSFVFDFDSQQFSVCQSYKSTYEKVPFDFLDAVYGDKNIYSTPRDLLRFDQAIRSNKFISKKLKQEIYKGYSYEKEGIKNYGLGIRLKEWSTGERIFYHNGWWHGNNTTYISLKEEKVTIIALSNKYTRKVYESIRLSSLFGNYPFSLEKEKDSTGVELKLE
jgi:CubicO group peptidase (beta-lactamase class C family)